MGSIKESMRSSQQGFTIVELIIAASVFSVIVLTATAGILAIGKSYYKGLTAARVQDTNRAIEDDITRSIQVSGNTIFTTGIDATNTKSFCIGNTRYTYFIDDFLGNQAAVSRTGTHALWKDIKKASSPCQPVDLTQSNPSDPAVSPTSETTPDAQRQAHEMLGKNMRISKFNVSEVSPGLFSIELRLMYAVDDVLRNHAVPDADPLDDTCLTNNLGGQFCAASELNTFVKRRL